MKQLDLSTRAGGALAGTERQAHAQEIRDASAQLASAQVAIYPVDARGLMSGMEATLDDAASRRIDSIVETRCGSHVGCNGEPGDHEGSSTRDRRHRLYQSE